MIADVALRKMTVTEFREMVLDDDDQNLYELIDGEVMARSAPNSIHQVVLAELYYQFSTYCRQQKRGKVLFALLDVCMDGYNCLQPDLVFLDDDRLDLLTAIGIEGSPSLVVETLSPTSVIRDRQTKYGIYERFGVPGYWLVDTAHREIEIYALQDGRYKVFSMASAVEGTLHSKLLPELALSLDGLFG